MLPECVVFLETWEADYFWRMSLRKRMQRRRKMKGNGRSRVCLGLLRETASDRPNTHTHTSLSLFFPPACSVLQGRPFAAEEGEEKEIYLRRDTFQHERRRTEEGREIYPRAHCSRRTFPPKGKARNSETIEKLDLTVEREQDRGVALLPPRIALPPPL